MKLSLLPLLLTVGLSVALGAKANAATEIPLNMSIPETTFTLEDMVKMTAQPAPIKPDDEPVLINTFRGARKHKYNLRGQKFYTYRISADHPAVVVDHELKVFKDGRPFKQQHPYKNAYLQTGKHCRRAAPIIDVLVGLSNGARLFTH